MHGLDPQLIDLARALIADAGWTGVVLAMALESAGAPLPSEISLPLAGWLLVAGHHHGWDGIVVASLLAALGAVLGASLAYAAGAWGRRATTARRRPPSIGHGGPHCPDEWRSIRGELAVVGARALPLARSFAGLPAGIARMPFRRFCRAAFVGAFLWSVPLTWAGVVLGARWERVWAAARFVEVATAIVVILLGAGWQIGRRAKVHRGARLSAASEAPRG